MYQDGGRGEAMSMELLARGRSLARAAGPSSKINKYSPLPPVELAGTWTVFGPRIRFAGGAGWHVDGA